ncbi:MAG: nuclear transport factor 2 family protein [Actinomycetota bacterium]|nr:nuclear transport factor 2 family protein [Actinomycetota bacterium]
MSQENTELLRTWFARLNEDGQPPLDLCDEQIEMRNPDGFPVTGPYHGHEGIRQWAFDTWEVLEDARSEPEEVIEVGDGESVVAVLRLTGVWRHTQLPVETQWASVTTFRDGKVVHALGYMSKAEALEAVGLRE